ncbi:MRG2 protein [Spatholobus suberectus]|nr:MRG2 protein [Spatholobus suberectus]
MTADPKEPPPLGIIICPEILDKCRSYLKAVGMPYGPDEVLEYAKAWVQFSDLVRIPSRPESTFGVAMSTRRNTRVASSWVSKLAESDHSSSVFDPEMGKTRKPAVDPDELVNIQIPPKLKKQLVDDCQFITHLGKLVKLPRTPNVNDILKNYFDCRLKKCGPMADSAEEIMKGLCCYFDKVLPVMLLYKNVRQQYQEACPANVFPSAIYGAEHLLRLFGMLVCLPPDELTI